MTYSTGTPNIVGSWLVSYKIGEPPTVLTGDTLDPLFAEGLVIFHPDGTFVASGSPTYHPPEASGRLFVGPGCGMWEAIDERRVAVKLTVLLHRDTGNSVATLFIESVVEFDATHGTLSGSYTVEVFLTRWWSADLPPLDGSVQAWRAPTPSKSVHPES